VEGDQRRAPSTVTADLTADPESHYPYQARERRTRFCGGPRKPSLETRGFSFANGLDRGGRWPAIEVSHLAIRHTKLIHQHGVSDSAEHCNFSSLGSTDRRFHGFHCSRHIGDVGEPNILRVFEAGHARGSSENHVAARHIGSM
jgi:hypothetical protein